MSLSLAKIFLVRVGISLIVASLLIFLSAWRLKYSYSLATFRLYCFLGAILLAIHLFLPIRRLITGVSLGCDNLEGEIAIRMQETGIFQKLRNYSAEFLHAISNSLLWPAYFHDFFFERNTPAQKPGNDHLEDWEHFISARSLESRYWLYALCLSVIVPLSYPVLGGSLVYIRYFLYLMIVCATIRILYYFLFHTSLTTLLRRRPKHPLWEFIKLVIIAYITMVVCLSIASHSGDISATTLSSLLATARQLVFRPPTSLIIIIRQFILVTPLEFTKIIQRAAVIDIAVLLCGSLAYGFFIQTVFRLKDFERQDDDKKNLARDSLMHGDYATALRWLKSTSTVDQELLYLSTATHLGLEDEDTARNYAQQLTTLNAIRPTSMTVALDPITHAFLEFPFPKSLTIQRLRELVAANERDASLYLLTESLVAANRIAPVDVLLTIKDAADRYPLTRAAHLRELGLTEQSLDLLKSKSFTNALREICRRTLILQTQIREPNLPQWAMISTTYAWVDANFRTVVELSSRLKEPRELSLAFRELAPLADWLARRRSPALNQLDSILTLWLIS